MRVHTQYFMRPCKRCGLLFRKTGRKCEICESCKIPPGTWIRK